MHVRTAYDPEQTGTLRSYHTYSWLEEPKSATSESESVVAPIVKRAVEEKLAEKGYVKSEEGPVDFKVGWLGAIKEKVDISTYDASYGYGWGSWYGPWPYDPQTVVHTYDQGNLVLSIVDPKQNRLVWRGAAASDLSSSFDAKYLEKKIDKAVDKILDKFPPS